MATGDSECDRARPLPCVKMSGYWACIEALDGWWPSSIIYKLLSRTVPSLTLPEVSGITDDGGSCEHRTWSRESLDPAVRWRSQRFKASHEPYSS